MEPAKTVSKSRIILTWAMMVGFIIFIAIFFFTRHHETPPPDESGMPAPNPILHSVVTLFIGGFFLMAGVATYLLILFTGCLTFNYRRPVWGVVKAKKYIFAIVVTVGLSLGVGFILSAFLSPLLGGLGLPSAQADLLPVLAILIGIQILQLWVLIWAPLEKRIIVKRLAAMGIPPEQLQGATLVGLSDPASGIVTRFGAIEEDMGALWVVPDRLAFRGDVEQFDLTRDQVVQIERRADNRSTTVLAGIAHVVLHVRLPDGNVRQIRLHIEGVWTMGQKRRGMDALAEAINQWHAAVPA